MFVHEDNHLPFKLQQLILGYKSFNIYNLPFMKSTILLQFIVCTWDLGMTWKTCLFLLKAT